MEPDSDFESIIADASLSDVWHSIKDQQVFQIPVKSANVKPPDCTRLVCISDTHSRHREVSHLPPGDVLVHAGDFSMHGELRAIQDISDYFGGLSNSFTEIVAIAGNHDRILHQAHYLKSERNVDATDEAVKAIRKNCIYLQDSAYTTSSGLELYGSPWTPEFCGWAFMLDRGPTILEKWRDIPPSTDILITHGPPLGRGDFVPKAGNVGCYDLLQEIQQRVKPRVNIFGHIHEGFGTTFDGETLYVNASSVDIRYRPLQYAIVVDVPHDRSKAAMVVPPIDCGLTLLDLPELCGRNGWSMLKASLDECDLTIIQNSLPNGFSLISDDAYISLCARLHLGRPGQVELAQALRAVHARSFPAVGIDS